MNAGHVLIAGRTHCHVTTDTQYIIVNVNVHYIRISSCYRDIAVHVSSVRCSTMVETYIPQLL